jgi:hypothetical protein
VSCVDPIRLEVALDLLFGGVMAADTEQERWL